MQERIKKVSEFGNGAHVTVPKEWLDDCVRITRVPDSQPQLFQQILKSRESDTLEVRYDENGMSEEIQNLEPTDSAIVTEEAFQKTAIVVLENSDETLFLTKRIKNDSWSDKTEVLTDELVSQHCEFDLAVMRYKISEITSQLDDTYDELSRELDDLAMERTLLKKDNDSVPEDKIEFINKEKQVLLEYRNTVESLRKQHESLVSKMDGKSVSPESIQESANLDDMQNAERLFATQIGVVDNIRRSSEL